MTRVWTICLVSGGSSELICSSLTLQEEEEEVSDCSSLRLTDEVRPGPTCSS